MSDTETRIEGFFARYEPSLAALGRAVRAKLRARLPGFFEIVYLYERQEALVFAYSPSDQGYKGLCSLDLRPGGLKLHFARGADLAAADPARRLQGRGTGVRHVDLHADDDVDALEPLFVAALELAGLPSALPSPLPLAGEGPGVRAPGKTILKAESQQKRARRAGGA